LVRLSRIRVRLRSAYHSIACKQFMIRFHRIYLKFIFLQ
jgi:hypothetical protein